jgi:putative tricarboxylic transport membrane protein
VPDFVDNLVTGFAAAASLKNILFALIGCMLGTLIGVLPGIGPIPTIAMLLPLTFGFDPLSSLIMLAGIYYGAQYGGSTTSILANVPGEASSVITCIEGHQMAKQGRAGAALAVAALGSFFAGTVGTILLATFGPLLATLSQQFRSPENFSLMVLGLVIAVVLAHGSIIKAIAVVLVGLLLGLVGTDINSGASRYTFGVSDIRDGIDFLPVVIGMFGAVEIIRNLERWDQVRGVVASKIDRLWPTREEFGRAWPAVLRGTGIGSILGVLPGAGGLLGAFAAYTVEKKVAKPPSRFGHGAIEGVAGPESANNAAAQTSFIPLLTLGLPSNAIMALMMGALMIHGIQPGAGVMTARPELFWGLVVSMWIGNALLLVINLPLIGIWVKLLSVPYRFLYPAVLIFCCVGIYATNNGIAQLVLAAIFTILGYVLLRLGCEPAPLILGFLLGPPMEENLRRSLGLSNGDPMIFLQQPISAILLAMTAIVILATALPALRKTRQEAFTE